MRKNAQSILEYLILLIIIVASLIIMRYYLRNSLSSKLREGADSIGQGEVYRPYAGGTTIIKNSVENRGGLSLPPCTAVDENGNPLPCK